MFDVPRAETSYREWHGDVDLDAQPWNVGLIVGPSGAGKSTLARELFEVDDPLTWQGTSVVDDFAEQLSMDDIAAVCQAVGFNTIPAWLRPYEVLSTGERFRVEMARLLLEAPTDRPLVVDEFSSVVDRQVAQIGSHAIAKWVRRHERQFVAVTCHYDVVDWLQPDWVLEPATMTIRWRSVQPRPRLAVTVSPVHHSAWRLFSPFHYLTAQLNHAASCFVLFVGDQPAAFAGVLHRPHAKAKTIKGVSRLVTLPDWQGLGLAFVLADVLGATYTAKGWRLRTYPAHPALIGGFDRSKAWALIQKPGMGMGIGRGKTSTVKWSHGERPGAVFEYAGPVASEDEAATLLANVPHAR